MKSPAMVASVDVHELQRRRLSEGKTLVWDVRTPGEFAVQHVAGARNLPLGSAEIKNAIALHAPSNEPVYVICASGARSRQGCAELVANGTAAVFSVEGGMQAWVAAGYPVEQSAGARRTISLERQVRIAAGSLVLAGVIASTWGHPGFYGLSAFVGAGLVFAGLTDWCGMGLLLARLPWNRR